jgi:spore germination protein YaaH
MRGITIPRLPVLLALGLVALVAGAGLAALTGGQGSGRGASAGSPSPVAVNPAGSPGASPAPPPSRSPTPSPAPTLLIPGQSVGPSANPSGPKASPSVSPLVDVPPHDPAKFGFVAKGMSGEVMAFATIPELAYVRDTMDFSAVSTLVFFSLQAGADGALQHDSRWRAWTASTFDAVRDRAHAAGTKVVVSVSRFSWSPAETAVTVALLSSPARRDKLALEIAAEVVRRGVDGVNVDLEPVPIGQKAAFTAFVRRLRAALDAAAPGLQLTVAITGYYSSYDVRGLVAPGAADAIYVMGYPYAGWWSKIAGSTAPLGGSGYTVAATIAKLRADGVPAERLIVGVPYYGHLWPTVSGVLNARTSGQGSDIPLVDALAMLARVTPRWDPIQSVTWAAWHENGTWVQLYVDDARALAAKWARFRSLGLLGTGMWTIGFEGAPGAANDALRAAWLAEPVTGDAGVSRAAATRPQARRPL